MMKIVEKLIMFALLLLLGWCVNMCSHGSSREFDYVRGGWADM